MSETIKVTWEDIDRATDSIVEQLREVKFDTIVGVMRGGIIPARILASKLGVERVVLWDGKDGVLGIPEGRVLLVDDIADTGATAIKAKKKFKAPLAVIVSKSSMSDYQGIEVPFADSRWVVFPWETRFDEEGDRQSERR